MTSVLLLSIVSVVHNHRRHDAGENIDIQILPHWPGCVEDVERKDIAGTERANLAMGNAIRPGAVRGFKRCGANSS